MTAPMNILVAFESSGRVREALRRRGHNAISCDLLDAEDGSPHHHKGDVRCILHNEFWDMLIAHPPCTWLCSSGLHWNDRGRQGLEPAQCWQETHKALELVRELMAAKIKKKAIENPVGIIGTHIRPADQIIQPNQFGEDASKATCLWLENLPLLVPTCYVEPRWVDDGRPQRDLFGQDGSPRWANQTDSGQNRLPETENRWQLRSRTYQGIAEAFATQWG